MRRVHKLVKGLARRGGRENGCIIARSESKRRLQIMSRPVVAVLVVLLDE
jgi:hypothetical protein